MSLLEEVDDTDMRIVYSQKWVGRTNPNEYNHTAHGTSSPGAVATFKFKGVSIKVYGTLDLGLIPTLQTPTSSYTIDNGSPTTYHDGNLVSMPQTLFGQVFFKTSAPLDPNAEHTLVITLLSSGGSTLWIDKIEVGTSESSSTVPSSTQAPPAASVPSTVLVTTSIAASESSPETSPTSVVRSTSEAPTSESVPQSSSSVPQSSSSVPMSSSSLPMSSSSFPTLVDTPVTGSVSSTSSQASSATDLASTSHTGVSEDATIGIVLGVCIPSVALIVMGIIYLRRRRRKKAVYQSLVPHYPIRSDWPASKTTTTTTTDVIPSSAGRNVSVQTSRWQIIEPFPPPRDGMSAPSGV